MGLTLTIERWGPYVIHAILLSFGVIHSMRHITRYILIIVEKFNHLLKFYVAEELLAWLSWRGKNIGPWGVIHCALEYLVPIPNLACTNIEVRILTTIGQSKVHKKKKHIVNHKLTNCCQYIDLYACTNKTRGWNWIFNWHIKALHYFLFTIMISVTLMLHGIQDGVRLFYYY